MIRAIRALFARQPDPAPIVSHAERSARREMRFLLLEQADDHRCKARALFRDAMRAEPFAVRYQLYSLAIAAELRAEACYAQAGGDHEAAALHMADAAEYEMRAGMPRPVEAAHA